MIKPVEIINIYEFSGSTVQFYKYNFRKNTILSQESVSAGEAFKPLPEASENLNYVILKRSDFIEKQLTVPSVNDSEISQMANIQALKLVPFSNEEIITHCQVINKSEDGYSNILLFIISQDKLIELLKPLISRRIFPDKIFLNSLILPKLLSALKKTDTQVNRFINLNDEYVEIGIFENQKLMYSRYIEGVLKNSKDRALLSSDILNSFEYASKKYGYDLSQTPYMTGTYSPEEIADYNISLENSEYIQYDKKDIFKIMASESMEICFSLPVVESKKQGKIARLYALRFVSVMILIMFSILGYFFAENLLLENRLSFINNEIKKIKDNADSAKDVTDKMDILTRHYANTDNYIGAILELYKLIPPDVTLTLLNFKDYKKVIIKGFAKKGVIDLVAILEKSQYFQNVSLKYQNKSGREEGVEFSLTCELENV